jgi:sigma-E factor negative regulatory protein RseC
MYSREGEKMQKQQEGVVFAVSSRIAKVKTSRHNDCENCGACPGNSAIVVNAYNSLGAKPGQRVVVEVQEINMLKAAFIVYLLPLLAVLVGAVAGAVIAGYFGTGVLGFQVAGGIVAFLLSVWYIKYFDGSAQRNEK